MVININNLLRRRRNMSRTQRDREGVRIRVSARIGRSRGRPVGRWQPGRVRARISTSSTERSANSRNVPFRWLRVRQRHRQDGERNPRNRRNDLNLRLAVSVGPHAFMGAGRRRSMADRAPYMRPRGPEGDSQHLRNTHERNRLPYYRRLLRPNNLRNEGAVLRTRDDNVRQGLRNQHIRPLRRQNLLGVRNGTQNRVSRGRRPFTLTSNTNRNVYESDTFAS